MSFVSLVLSSWEGSLGESTQRVTNIHYSGSGTTYYVHPVGDEVVNFLPAGFAALTIASNAFDWPVRFWRSACWQAVLLGVLMPLPLAMPVAILRYGLAGGVVWAGQVFKSAITGFITGVVGVLGLLFLVFAANFVGWFFFGIKM